MWARVTARAEEEKREARSIMQARPSACRASRGQGMADTSPRGHERGTSMQSSAQPTSPYMQEVWVQERSVCRNLHHACSLSRLPACLPAGGAC